jgi:hypothetical protein
MEKVFRECFKELATEVSRKDAKSRYEAVVLYSFAPLRETLSLFIFEKLAEFFAKLRAVLMAV